MAVSYIDGDLQNQIDQMGTLREVPFAVAVSDWSGSGTFTANFTTAYITTTSKEIVNFDSSFRTYAKADINTAKKSGGGGLTLTTTKKPTGTITGTIFVFDSQDGKIPYLIENTVAPIANGGTGQSSLAGAQEVLGITALNDNFTNFRYRTLTNVDINSLYGVENAGFYYVSTGNTNGPGAYSSLIVISGSDSSYQLSVTAGNRIKIRKRVGNPPSWSAWVDLGTYDTGTITKNASGITDGNFHLSTETISGTLLVVTGYINITTAITNNTKIATVSIAPKTDVFQSVVSSSGKTGRFKLTTNGEIFCESALEANSGYYSMTFVSNYV